MMGVAFEMVRWLGEGLIRWVLDPLFAHLWTPVMLGLFHLWDGTPFLQTIFIGHLINGQIDFTLSMGVCEPACNTDPLAGGIGVQN
jgi:ferrous iron transport protein B